MLTCEMNSTTTWTEVYLVVQKVIM